MAAGFEKDEALLGDCEDWSSKMCLPLKPRYQPGLLKACQPPAQRTRPFSDNSSDNRSHN